MSLPPVPRSDRVLFGLSGLVLLVVVVIAFAREIRPPWHSAQEQVRAAAMGHVPADQIEALPHGVQQIWIEPLARVDRCTTCHQTIDWGEALAQAPHPARSHPNPALLAAHPVEQFGCTLCHGGQGIATSTAAAHGDVAHWEEPMLSEDRAKTYGLTRAELMELRCNQCHQQEEHVVGMPLLNEAKALVTRLKCARCHTIHGEGGTQAPDLTREGDKHPTQFHFPAEWTKSRTALQWHIEHFLDPAALSPNSEMTKYPMTRRQAASLALLVLSWRKLALPARWVPTPGSR